MCCGVPRKEHTKHINRLKKFDIYFDYSLYGEVINNCDTSICIIVYKCDTKNSEQLVNCVHVIKKKLFPANVLFQDLNDFTKMFCISLYSRKIT